MPISHTNTTQGVFIQIRFADSNTKFHAKIWEIKEIFLQKLGQKERIVKR
jgi:hypothetical protein